MIEFAETHLTEEVIPLSQNLEPKTKIGLIADDGFDDFLLKLNDLNENVHFPNPIHLSKNIDDSEIIFIYSQNQMWAEKKLLFLKSQNEHFLKPVLLFSEIEQQKFLEFSDEYLRWPVSPAEYKMSLEKLFQINTELSLLQNPVISANDTALKKIILLRYLHTRKTVTFEPLRSHHAKIGYTYPLAAALFDLPKGEEEEHLEALEESQLIHSKLIDKVNLCPNCNHTHINYREVCPHCNSLNIFEETTIHHFQCAYVGKESEYAQGTQLICPKCSRELRHIGVDYDKPAEMLWCTSCKHNFSEPELTCFCLACAHNFKPEDAFLKIISKYTLSGEGCRAAEEGVLPGFGIISILKKELGFYKYEVFKEFLKIELARCRRYKYESTLARFSLKSKNEMFEKNKTLSSRKFRKDFSEILNQTFRTTDIFTEKANGDVLIIFNNTPQKNVKIAFQRLDGFIQKHFNIGLKLNYQLLLLTTPDANLDNFLGEGDDS